MKKSKIIEKLLQNRQFMMLFSLVAAFLFWFFVVANISPNASITVSNVPVTVDENTGLLSNAGLRVIEESTSKISLEISGPRYIIGRLKSSDFTITPDVGPVNKSGQFSLKLEAAMKKPNPNVKVHRISPSYIDINFDTISSKSVPIEVKVLNGKVADGYMLETPTVSPKQVVVTGPSAEIDQVAHAVATATLDGSARSSVTLKCNVQLLDGKNSAVSLDHIKTDTQTTNVTVPVLRTKTVALSVDFSNLPAGFDPSNISCQISPKEIQIAGPEKEVNTLSAVKLAPIDFSKLDISNSLIQPILTQTGITSVDNLTSASVSVNLLNTGKKTLSTKDIRLINIPKGYTVKIVSRQINNITLFGPSSEIGNISSVAAVIDMSAVNLVEGTSQVPLTITVPDKTGFWVAGSYTATISAWRD